MKKFFIYSLLTAQIFTACSNHPNATVTATAVIRATKGNPPVPQNTTVVEEIFQSVDLGKHTCQSLGLAKTWGVTEFEAINKIRKSIRVKNDGAPDLVLIEIRGLEHDLAVKILNDLCTNACGMELTISENNEPSEKENMTVVQPAK